jgi:cyclophilin family peptidyl-prolyl cis-trans isomerase
MFDLLFESQEEWMGLSPNSFREWIVQAAGQLLLDRQRLESLLDDPEIRSRIDASARRAQANGLPGAPIIFVNGRNFQPPPSVGNLEAAVRLELLALRQYARFPAMRIDPTGSYQALLVFDRGDVVIELFPQTAPAAVNSFVFLSEENWYDGTSVHRVLPGVLFETGDPSGTGLGGPGYSFQSEVDPGLAFDRAGRVAMASVGPGTNGSQFFITLAPEPGLDGSRTIFGQVMTGLDPFLTLPARDPLADLLEPPSAILQAVHILLQ